MQNKNNETGRSMVEMLGVLAIIGVLSVTGVAGYKAAVRKALANNLLNQASMRATDVATQIASGNLDSLGNDAFDGNLGSGVTMSSAVKGPDGYTDYDESDEQFTLSLEGLDEELCQQMQSMAGGSRSVVRAVLCDGDKAILTFNKDLSSNPVSSDFDGNKEGCESSGRKYCDNDTCIPATEECPTGEGGEGSSDSCNADIVNVYNCETKTTTPCCPDNGNSCEQPKCSCGDDDDCLGQQVCSGGLCGCPTNAYGDSGAPSTTDPGVCCRNGFALSENGYFGVNIACLDEGKEYYCSKTDSDGECDDWWYCDTGKSTGESIIGMPYASGACAGEGEEVHCLSTNSDGECQYWGSCEIGKSSESIIGMPNAGGACGGEGYELYCFYTNSDGECYEWNTCEIGKSGGSIIGIPYATGACAYDEGEEVYCEYTESDGECPCWSLCPRGKSSGDSIIGMPDVEGVCAGGGEEVYCGTTNSAGKCTWWDICEIGKSSGKSIIGMPDAEGACVGAGYELYCAVTNSAGECFKWSGCETGESVSASGPNATGTCND